MKIKFKNVLLFLMFLPGSVIAMELAEYNADPKNPVNLIARFQQDMYKERWCAICGQRGAEVYWFGSYSESAHKACFDLVLGAEKESLAKLEEVFNDGENYKRINAAHKKMVQIVEEQIGVEGERSIKDYCEKYGPARLKLLFDATVALAIYKQMYEKR